MEGGRRRRGIPRTLVARLFVLQVSVVLAVLLAMGVVVDRVLERNLLDGLAGSLTREAKAARAELDDVPADELQAATISLGDEVEVRITLIAEDGTVLADSERDPSTGIENHAGRPEVRAALRGEVGVATRLSETVGREFLYVALPPRDGTILRVALPLTEVRAEQGRIRVVLVVGLIAAAAATAIGVLLANRGVVRPLRRMRGQVDRLSEGDLDARVEPAGIEEVEALGDTLNRMAGRLSSQVASTRHEQALRDLILAGLEDGVLLATGDGDVVFVNPAVERLLGGRPERVPDLFPPALRDAVERAAAEDEPVPVEVSLDRPPRSVRATATSLEGGDLVLLVLRDTTEPNRVDRVRRDFVVNASHELKTPAAAIQATAETLRMAAADDPEAVPRMAETLEREAFRLSRVVEDLLDLSRLEAGPLEPRRVDLAEVVREEAERHLPEAAERGIAFAVDAPGPAEVQGSASDLSLLVGNLIDNALRYTRPGGSVDVTLTAEDGERVLRVRDTGIGIPTRDLPRVFERFYRVDRARSRETGGTGLGLSIVKHVAETHGGSVDVTSELGVGSEFVVRIPETG
jgi:two-component system phosphate regulon sensor histidine kinase PhoR